MGYHYPYNASSAHRWLACPASKAFELEGKTTRSPAGIDALTGTAAHYLAEWALRRGYADQVDERLVGARVRISPDDDAFALVCGPGANLGASFAGINYASDATETNDERYPTVIKVDEAMVKGVAIYTHTVLGILRKYQPDAFMRVECGFELSKDMGGMSDVVIGVPSRLIVLDYKNGRNPVDPVNNAQLAMYGVGALAKFASSKIYKDVVMGVVQPNAPGPAVKTWTLSVDELITWRDKFERGRFYVEKARADLRLGRDMDAHCMPGDHCRWCPAMSLCPAMHRQTLELAQTALSDLGPTSATVPEPAELDDERLLWIANNGDAIVEFVTKCKEHMTEQAKTGKKWPGFKLVESRTKRRIANHDLAIHTFKDAGESEAFELKLKSISKLEKIFGKERIAEIVEKPKGALVMVPMTDPRPDALDSVLASVPALLED